MNSMAAQRWWPQLFRRPTHSDADTPEARQQQKDLRHDYDGHLNKISLASEVARRSLDAIESHVEYLRATRRTNGDDDSGGGVDPGVGERADDGGLVS